MLKGRTGRRGRRGPQSAPGSPADRRGPAARAPTRGIRGPGSRGRPPASGPRRPYGLDLGGRRRAATALDLVAEGVPAGRGDPVEGLARIVRLELAGRCIRRGRFLGAVPTATGGRQLDPAEGALPAEIKVRGGCRDERLQGPRDRLELDDGRVDVPPERQGTAPVEQEGPSLGAVRPVISALKSGRPRSGSRSGFSRT